MLRSTSRPCANPTRPAGSQRLGRLGGLAHDGTDVETLMHAADKRMLKLKGSRRMAAAEPAGRS